MSEPTTEIPSQEPMAPEKKSFLGGFLGRFARNRRSETPNTTTSPKTAWEAGALSDSARASADSASIGVGASEGLQARDGVVHEASPSLDAIAQDTIKSLNQEIRTSPGPSAQAAHIGNPMPGLGPVRMEAAPLDPKIPAPGTTVDTSSVTSELSNTTTTPVVEKTAA